MGAERRQPHLGQDDTAQVAQYPVGTQPDRNWRGSAYNFGQHLSPNGVIEWTSNGFFASQKGKLLVVRYSGGDDIVALTLDRQQERPGRGPDPSPAPPRSPTRWTWPPIPPPVAST